MRPLVANPIFALVISLLSAAPILAQAPAAPPHPPGTAPVPRDAAPTPGTTAPAPARVRHPDYPEREGGDPAKIAHGKQLFGVNCAFCHGSDARGGETGPNLVRSQLVLDDHDGELITPVVVNGRISKGMPAFPLAQADINDISAYIHNQKMATRDHVESAPINILVGDEAAGKNYFEGKCAKCHSVTKDLAGIGGRLQPKILQNAIVSGVAPGKPGERAHRPEITATVTLPSGKKVEGKLVYRDAFFVGIEDAEKNHHSYPADLPGTKVDVHNPLQAHTEMLATWKDSDIHNLTKYLSTLK